MDKSLRHCTNLMKVVLLQRRAGKCRCLQERLEFFVLQVALYIRSDSGSKNGSQADGLMLAEAIDDWKSSSVTLRAAMDDLFSALA